MNVENWIKCPQQCKISFRMVDHCGAGMEEKELISGPLKNYLSSRLIHELRQVTNGSLAQPTCGVRKLFNGDGE